MIEADKIDIADWPSICDVIFVCIINRIQYGDDQLKSQFVGIVLCHLQRLYLLIMARSDLEEKTKTSVSVKRRNMVNESGDMPQDKASDTIIHSGHFMVSCIDEDDVEENEEKSKVSEDIKQDIFDVASAAKDTRQTYKFGQKSSATLELDASLTKLFQCLTVSYRFVKLHADHTACHRLLSSVDNLRNNTDFPTIWHNI